MTKFTRCALAGLAFVVASIVPLSVFSQSLDQSAIAQLSEAERQKLLQSGGRETFDSAPLAPVVVRQNAGNVAINGEGRDAELQLFGYGLFTRGDNNFQPSAQVPIPENYVLGPGDVVRVQLFGNQNETLNLSVTRDGSINFPKLGPIQVAGLSIDDTREVIDRRVAKELIGVQTNITLGPLRGVQVFLLGDANQPGAYAVSGLATITNALFIGGGVARSGSLRKIELKRAGRVVQRLDLYDFLLRGDSSRDVRIQAGDSIFIPPAGPRVAVAGAVIRPAIYEINETITVRGALDLAGGLTASALRAQVILERVGKDGQRTLRELDINDAETMSIALRDGDRLSINSVYERAENTVAVMGHVRYERSFAWSKDLTLGQVIAQAQIRPSEAGRELYPVMALIESADLESGLRSWRGFDLASVRAGTRDEPLQAQDRVVVLSRNDINYLLSPEVRSALRGILPRAVAEQSVAAAVADRADQEDRKAASAAARPGTRAVDLGGGVCPGLLELAKIADSARATSIRILMEAQANAAENRTGQASGGGPCPAVFVNAPTALPFLLENSAGLVGEVRQPGLYPFVQGTTVGRLTAAAGGETSEADRTGIEFFDFEEVSATAAARFHKVPRGTDFAESQAVHAVYRFLPANILPAVGAVNIRGEVRFPGRYVIARGERYSDVLARAGGLSDEAYAYGTVFTRASAREQEASANRRAASDLRESLVSAVTSGVSTPDDRSGGGGTSAVVLDLVQRLENAPAVGRVVIEADPNLLALRQGADFLMEPGDEIFVPKRPNSVSVVGQVLSPGSLAFISGSRPEDYLKQAGGFTQSADDGRAFLILPNGSARPLQTSFWRTRQEAIPPGSVIVVPRDVAPFTGLLLTERITSVLANLALSAAALVTINR